MANPIQKYLNRLLYPSAAFTDTTKITPCFVFNGDGQVLTASGYVDPSTITGGILEFDDTTRITPVIFVNEDMVPYPQPQP